MIHLPATKKTHNFTFLIHHTLFGFSRRGLSRSPSGVDFWRKELKVFWLFVTGLYSPGDGIIESHLSIAAHLYITTQLVC